MPRYLKILGNYSKFKLVARKISFKFGTLLCAFSSSPTACQRGRRTCARVLGGTLIFQIGRGNFFLSKRIARVGDRMHCTAALAIPWKFTVLTNSFGQRLDEFHNYTRIPSWHYQQYSTYSQKRSYRSNPHNRHSCNYRLFFRRFRKPKCRLNQDLFDRALRLFAELLLPVASVRQL